MKGITISAMILLGVALTVALLVSVSPSVSGDEPSVVDLSYDYDAEDLSVTITHPVDNPNVHYIITVDVWKNSGSKVQHDYTSQPDKTSWTYHYTITAENGDKLSATATCNEEGSLTGQMTVDHTDQSMDLSLTPPGTVIDENITTGFTLRVESGGDPVEGATTDITADLGGITGVSELGGGDYQFDYLSPEVESDQGDTIAISVSKRGYTTTLLERDLTIHNILADASKVNMTVSPVIVSLDEGTSASFTISVESEGSPLEDATLTVVPVYGSATDVLEIGAGDYDFSYTAPDVNGNVEEQITIGISKTGYETSYQSINFTILNGADTEHKICIFMLPETDVIEGGDVVNVTLLLEAGCEPVSGVTVVVGHSFGAISNAVDNSDGSYDFTYFAPEDKEGEQEVITISVSSEGYRSNEKEFNFTIIHTIPPVETGDLDGNISEGEYDFMTSFGGGNFEVHWKIEGDEIAFAWLGKTTGWVSLGLDPGKAMADADMILAWVDNTGVIHVVDAYSKGPTGPHPPDTNLGGTDDVLAFGGSERDGITIIEFRRKLSTGDQYDKDIPSTGQLKVIWSTGPSDDFYAIHSGSRVGSGILVMDTGESIEEDSSDIWPVHAAFMSIGILSMLTAFYIARFRNKEKWWLKYHRTLGLVGSGSTILGLVIGFYMVEDATGDHIRVNHAIGGLLAILLAIITPLVGLLMFKYKKQIKIMKQTHRWLGRVTILMMIIVIITGLQEAGVI
jgi:hypothetical protein